MKSRFETPINRFSLHPEICGCCLAPARGAGYAPAGFSKGRLHFKQFMWFCADPVCLAAMKDVYDMPADIFDKHLDDAIDEARRTAGRYAIEQIGKTDLAQMTFEEYHEFARVLVNATIADLRHRVAGHPAPAQKGTKT